MGKRNNIHTGTVCTKCGAEEAYWTAAGEDPSQFQESIEWLARAAAKLAAFSPGTMWPKTSPGAIAAAEVNKAVKAWRKAISALRKSQ